MGQLDQACQEASPKPLKEIPSQLIALSKEIESLQSEVEVLLELLASVLPHPILGSPGSPKDCAKSEHQLCSLAEQIKAEWDRVSEIRSQISQAANLIRL